jgi:hypothetical protein
MEPLNVVLNFLESIRADIMPVDGSTPWAQRFVPDPKRVDAHCSLFFQLDQIGRDVAHSAHQDGFWSHA